MLVETIDNGDKDYKNIDKINKFFDLKRNHSIKDYCSVANIYISSDNFFNKVLYMVLFHKVLESLGSMSVK